MLRSAPMSMIVTLADLYEPIAEPLEAVRGEVRQLWEDALKLVNLENMPSPKLGGKLLRPALCLLSAGAVGGTRLPRYVKLASAFEALHIASLAHDDVIDRALMRRGTSSLPGLWDNHAAVLGGDYLVARAVEMLCQYDACAVVANAITSVRRMAEGELGFFGRDWDNVREEDCVTLARMKTASLFAEACAAPTFILNAEHRDALHAFGMGLGVAFQLVDDLLDVTQPASVLGKPSCGDITEDKPTLPVLYLRESLSRKDFSRFETMRNSTLTDDDRAWVLEQMDATGARDRAENVARRYRDEALDALRTLPESEHRRTMESITEFVLIRVA